MTTDIKSDLEDAFVDIQLHPELFDKSPVNGPSPTVALSVAALLNQATSRRYKGGTHLAFLLDVAYELIERGFEDPNIICGALLHGEKGHKILSLFYSQVTSIVNSVTPSQQNFSYSHPESDELNRNYWRQITDAITTIELATVLIEARDCEETGTTFANERQLPPKWRVALERGSAAYLPLDERLKDLFDDTNAAVLGRIQDSNGE